jgi:hypothetical protein
MPRPELSQVTIADVAAATETNPAQPDITQPGIAQPGDSQSDAPKPVATPEFQTLEQRLRAEITAFLKHELQYEYIPLQERMAKGFRLATKLRLTGETADTLAQNFDVVESFPVADWPEGVQKLYTSGCIPAVAQVPQAGLRERTLTTLALIQREHPQAPLQLLALDTALNATELGSTTHEAFRHSRYLSLSGSLSPALFALVSVDLAAHTAVGKHMYHMLEYLLNLKELGSIVSDGKRLEDLFLTALQTAGYHAAVRAYAEQQVALLQPTATFPHPMNLWRAATQPEYLMQYGSYEKTNQGLANKQRNTVFKLLIARNYDAALEQLRAVSATFPRVVQSQFLDRAQGIGEAHEAETDDR